MVSIPNALALQLCNLIVDSVDTGGAGTLRFYAGTPPANVDAALSSNSQLAALPLSSPAFGDAADVNPGARATANAITSDNSADATGTATFARILDGNGTPRLQLTVSDTEGSGEIQMDSTSFTIGEPVNVASMTLTVPE